MSVSITARKRYITCSKVKKEGLNRPFRAISIMPLENIEPKTTPRLATRRMIRIGATLEPMAELRKLTASLLTPTIRSTIAAINKMASRAVKKSIEEKAVL
jgi:hypothetical protein